MSVVFSRASGVSWFLVRSAPDCWGGWRVAGGSGVRGLARLFPALLFVGGGFGGASARVRFLSCPVLAVVGVGGRGRVRASPGFLLCCGGGRVVPGFLFVFAVLLSCSRGVFGCCFFRPVLLVSSGSAVLGPLLGCGFRGVGGLWGVSGWVRGCFFSGFCCTGPGLFPVSFVGAGSGWGRVLFGEFDPGSGRTLAACLTHASRTGPPLWGWVEWRTGEYHVSNLPPAPG